MLKINPLHISSVHKNSNGNFQNKCIVIVAQMVGHFNELSAIDSNAQQFIVLVDSMKNI